MQSNFDRTIFVLHVYTTLMFNYFHIETFTSLYVFTILMFNYFCSETFTSLLLQLCIIIINIIMILTFVVITGLVTIINVNNIRPYFYIIFYINIIVVIMSNNGNCVSSKCTFVGIYVKIIRCQNVLFIYIINTSKYDHFTPVFLTWSICCSSPVSCVCDVYPGLSPSASCLDVANATTEMVVVTPVPGQSLSPFSLRMGRGPSRISVDTYLMNKSTTIIIVLSPKR